MPGSKVALGSGDAQEEQAAKNLQKLVKLDKLDKSCAKNEKRVSPSMQRVLDNAYTRKRLQRRRFEAYLKVIEERKQQCASHLRSDPACLATCCGEGLGLCYALICQLSLCVCAAGDIDREGTTVDVPGVAAWI